jgi:glucose/arabinose dehydrogenase
MRVRAFVFTLILAVLGAAGLRAQPPLGLTPVTQDALGPLTGITHAGDGSGRLFLTQQTGEIRVLEGDAVLDTPFLDLSGLVAGGGERGLLSLAFHPRYVENGLFYVNYTDLTGSTVVARYSVSTADPDRADSGSAQIVLTQEQPFSNHNGGQLQFGPDGKLYIGIGDGGGANDPQGNGQRRDTLLGKLLRIDVDAGEPYAIPEDNPFVDDPSTRPEIWALGLRNPWRFSFDRSAGDLFVADVGQSSREEVDFEPAGSPGGRNYGWVAMEGSLCRLPPGGCDAYTPPVLEYDHSRGCSITGGYRYRGLRYPALAGLYFYADYCSNRLWAASESAGSWSSWEWNLGARYPISTFGEDEEGTLYLGTTDGRLLRLESGEAFVQGDLDGSGGADLLWQNAASGATGAWLMQDLALATPLALFESLPDTGWRLVGTHDLDADGDSDLVWQHLSQGWLAVTHLEGTGVLDSELLEPDREPDLAWRVVATGDFDLDGAPDLVWRHGGDGRLRVWLMDGRLRRQSVPLVDDAPLDPAWRLAAALDLNRDGRLDLLFHEQNAGWLAAWLMRGTAFSQARLLSPAAVSPDWVIAGSGELAFGGTSPELIWRHRLSGALAATFLEGTTLVGASALTPAAVADPAWLLLGPR